MSEPTHPTHVAVDDDNQARLMILANSAQSFVTAENMNSFQFVGTKVGRSGQTVYMYRADDGREVHLEGNGGLYASKGPDVDENGEPVRTGEAVDGTSTAAVDHFGVDEPQPAAEAQNVVATDTAGVQADNQPAPQALGGVPPTATG